MKRSRVLGLTAAGIIVATAISAVVEAGRVRMSAAGDDVPLAQVKRGDVDLRVYGTAELRASHSMTLSAPAIGGDALQITHLVKTGTAVKKGDVIVEFDPSEQHYKLEQSHSELLQAEQEITKAKADAIVLAAQDKVALLKDRYAVRKAELDVQKNELVSKIDADKNNLALVQARRVLAEQENDIESHKQSGQAATYLAQEKYNKARLEMDQAQQNLDKMRVTSPMDGLVSIQKNIYALGGIMFSGMTMPDYHPGDQVQPGTAIALVVDPQGMELVSKVSEQDRGNLKPGEPVQVVFDALPGETFRATIKSVGGMTVRSAFFDSNSAGNFDVTIELARMDPRLRSGFTAHIVFLPGDAKNVVYLPRLALFLKDGKRIVYVKNGSGYDQREVKIDNETESRAIVTGLNAGDRVALVDPAAPRKTSGAGSSAAGGGAL